MQSDSSDSFADGINIKTRNTKRRKTERGHVVVAPESAVSFAPLLDLIGRDGTQDTALSFEDLMDSLLVEYLQDRARLQEKQSEMDEHGQRSRPLTRHEVSAFIKEAEEKKLTTPLSVDQSVNLRKLKLQRERRRVGLPETSLKSYWGPVTPLPPTPPSPTVNPQIFDALYSIKTTPYDRSFLSRLVGSVPRYTHGVIAMDWETISPWMHLLRDIRDHYSLIHPDREQPNEIPAPISYQSLQPYHLDQVHDLLTRVFWSGIDVSDTLYHFPERCTVIATYKKLVVGVAFISSPQETYITYLAVKAGWDSVKIATTMLYHLITLNPNKDITLHVSANNPAMLLYNRFGFKAEEFVVGFYEDYLDPGSRASKNAFRLRLRR